MSYRKYKMTRRGARAVTLVAFASVVLIGIEAAARAQQAGGQPEATPAKPRVIADGVTVSGLQVGGMTAGEARRAINRHALQPVEVTFRSESWSYAPTTLGARADVDAAVREALTRAGGRCGPARGCGRREAPAALDAVVCEGLRRQAKERRDRPARPPSRGDARADRTKARALDDAHHAAHAARERRALAGRPHRAHRQAAGQERRAGPRDRDQAGLEQARPLPPRRPQGHEGQRKFGVATGQAAYPTPLGNFEIVSHAAQPLVAPARLGLGRGRRADPARPRQPAGHALDGAFTSRRSASTARPTRPRSATPPPTAASACSSRRPSGSSNASRRARPSTSSTRSVDLGGSRGAARGPARRRGAARPRARGRPLGGGSGSRRLALAPLARGRRPRQLPPLARGRARARRRRARRALRRRRAPIREGDRQHPLPDPPPGASRPRDRLDVELEQRVGHGCERRGEAPPPRPRLRDARLHAGRVQDGRAQRALARGPRGPPSPLRRHLRASTCSSATAQLRDSAYYAITDDEWPAVKREPRAATRGQVTAATGGRAARGARRRARASPAATTRDRPLRSSGAEASGGSSGRSTARPRSRTSSCAAAMSTLRAGLSETTASTRPAARWQSERASEPMTRVRTAKPTIPSTVPRRGRCASPRARGSRSVPSAVGRRAARRSGTRPRPAGPPIPRRSRSRARSPARRPPCACRRPPRARARRTGMPRLALRLPSIGSHTTVSPSPPSPKTRSPNSSDTSVKPAGTASSRATTAASAAASTAVVSSPPFPSPTRGSRSRRVGSSSSTRPTAARRVAANLQPVDARHSSKGENRSPLVSLGKKYVLFGGIRTPARANSSTCSNRGRAHQERRRGLAARDGALGLDRARREADLREGQRVHQLGVELLLAPLDQRRALRPEQHERRTVALHSRRAPRRPRPAPASGVCLNSPVQAGDGPGGEPVRREDLEPLVVQADEDGEDVGRLLGAVLLVEAPRASRSGGGRRRSGAALDPARTRSISSGSSKRQSRLATPSSSACEQPALAVRRRGPGPWWSMKIGDGFIRVARSSRSRASFGPGERPLVREHGARRRRASSRTRATTPRAGRGTPSGPGVVLFQEPDRRPLLAAPARPRSASRRAGGPPRPDRRDERAARRSTGCGPAAGRGPPGR